MNSKESVVQSRIGSARVVNTISDLTPIPPVLPAFVSTWKTDNLSTGSSTNTQVRLPTVSNGTYNMTVDWGDGSSDVITVWNQAQRTHTYGAIGTYVITITGTCSGWTFLGSTDKLKILSIQSFGQLRLRTNFGGFRDCANLSLSSVTDVLNLSGETSIVSIFQNCTSLTKIPFLQNWDFSSVVLANLAFAGATNFDEDFGSPNFSNLTNAQAMFNGALAFDQNIGDWDVSKVAFFSNFMLGKTPATFSATNLDAIYNGWSQLNFVNTGLSINFGTAKYTVAGSAGRAILTSAPLNFNITDGGQI